MSLKQSIVIVNSFTYKASSGKGTRGNTPGDYILRYMSREGATESVAPVRLMDADSYALRYAVREQAVDTMHSVTDIKTAIKKADKKGGIAFGRNNPSMSDESLKRESKLIQRAFDSGKTVMETVLSFDEKYLKETGIVDNDFELSGKGGYKGNIDQMKLRLAIMHGVDRMSRDYDDLHYVGVIQVDTEHVHCHLAMADLGVGHLMPDGSQRGKITERSKRDLRRGIDMYLDDNQKFHRLVGYQDKRNVKCFIKKFTHRTIAEHGTPQFLMACLPDDKRLWRADTNDRRMKKANDIVRTYVLDVLNQPESGYQDALRDVYEYSVSRRNREGLTDKQHRKLIDDGRKRIVHDCMNGVYSMLKQIPDDERRVSTPMLDVMSMDYQTMADAGSDPVIEFGFRLRSYSSRLGHHKKERRKYHDLREDYERLPAEEKSDDSAVVHTFYQIEEDYNAMLMAKYQHFLLFLPPADEYRKEFNELTDYSKRMKLLRDMREDKTFNRLSGDSAEAYGLDVYDMHGGRYVKSAPYILDERYARMCNTYADKKREFDYHLTEFGLAEQDGRIKKEIMYAFDDVKALDLHHLGYDFANSFDVSYLNVEAFGNMADRRYTSFMLAKGYFINSSQEHILRNFPEADIVAMKQLADQLRDNNLFVSNVTGNGDKQRRVHTVQIDEKYDRMMTDVIQNTVQSMSHNADYQK